MSTNASILTAKIQSLTAEQITEVDNFVESLRMRGEQRKLSQAYAAISIPSFEVIWSNPEDDAYDAL